MLLLDSIVCGESLVMLVPIDDSLLRQNMVA